MVEINNQRKGVPRYAGGSEELITDVRKPEPSGYDVRERRRAIYSIT